MRRLAFFAALLLGTVSLLSFSPLHAAAGAVEYTWTLAALGQGGWIGGPLFEDGTVGGGGAFSAGNGKLLARFDPTTWTENSSDQITICFDVTVVKGPSNALPPTICLGPAEVTGTPIKVMLFFCFNNSTTTEN